MKLCVILTAHCPPAVVKLTIGSFIRTLGPGYELDIHVGLHSNYADYTTDLSIFEELKGIASIHLIDEIDWTSSEHNACIYRYSTMHAKNLLNIFNHVRYTNFDYVLILDQDLFFKKDIVTPSISQSPNSDLIGSLFEDRIVPWHSTTVLDNRTIHIMPKMSIWHLILSKQGFNSMMESPNDVYPIEIFHPPTVANFLKTYKIMPDTSIFFDTFARVYHNMLINKDVRILKSNYFSDYVEHFYKSSFNYGQRNLGIDGYTEHTSRIKNIYNREFPNGLSEFRRSVIT